MFVALLIGGAVLIAFTLGVLIAAIMCAAGKRD